MTDADLLGRKFLRLPQSGLSEIAAYFEAVKTLQPFLRSNELDDLVKGFFLSMWTDGGIRFSYFTDDAERSSRGLDEQLPRLGVVRYMDDEIPVSTALEYYTSETRTNLTFRRFLQLMTNVGLDLLDYDVSYARRLAAKYRLDIGPSGESSRPYFEKGFKRAAVYRALDSSLQEELLEGLDTWHSPWEDWPHFLMVMLLPGDWIYSQSCRHAFNPRRPLSKDVRDMLASGLLPDDWEP